MILKPVTELLHTGLDLLFPPRCEICHTLQEPVICDTCLRQFSLIQPPYCEQCGLPFDPLAKSSMLCYECQHDTPAFDCARVVGRYEGALRRAIQVYKYELVRALARPFAELMLAQIPQPFPVDFLCPVPLHPARERMRGFNQSLLLAERLGEAWQIPVRANYLHRVQDTVPQMQLPREERRQNIRGVFAVPAPLAGATVAIIDDVYTTGATLRECSKVVRAAGAERILVLTVARTI